MLIDVSARLDVKNVRVLIDGYRPDSLDKPLLKLGTNVPGKTVSSQS